MNQINAVEFSDMLGANPTPDGQHGLFKFATAQGDITVALPNAQLPKVMAAISDISSKNSRKLSGNPRQTMALSCSMWDIAPGSNETVNFSFKIPGGMEMTFAIARNQIALMKDALTAAESGQPVVLPYGQIE